MFENLQEIWSNHGLEIAVIACVIFIGVMAYLNKGKQGTFEKEYDAVPYVLPASSIRRKPVRTVSRGEEECKRVMEEIFERPFTKVRPDILKNPITNGSNNLEIDCYNEDLKLGVEYNGQQHYEYSPYFHRSKEAFENQKYRDYIKRELCLQNGIHLVEVPYTVKPEDIRGYLIQELLKAGYIRNE